MKKSIYLLTFFSLLFAFEIFPQQQSRWDHIPEAIRETNSFKRFEWFYRQRAYPYDTISTYTFLRERENEINKEGAGSNLLQWTNIGPSGIVGDPIHPQWGEVSGRIKGIAVDPTNPNIVYIGAASGGLWKTTNGGESWADIGDNLASLTFGSVAIDPNNTNTVYAGAGEIRYGFSTNGYDGKGLYKSTDAGANWVQITDGFGEATSFGDLEVSPHNSNILFAALGSGYFFSPTQNNEGIWKSTDNGVTWVRKLNVQDAFDLIIHPTDPNIVYAATGGGIGTSGFYISTDGGESFDTSNTGLPSASDIKRIQISLAHSSLSTIYSVIYDNANGTKAYKSTNGGSSWFQISTGVNLGGFDGSQWRDQGGYDLTIAVNPSNANEVYIGNIEIHKTIDGSLFSPVRIPPGANVDNSPMHNDYQKIVFAPSNNNIIYVGSDGGIFKSTDGGLNWASINSGITTIQFYRLVSHPSDPNTLFGGAQDNGNFRTADGGTSQWHWVTPGDGMECFYDWANPNTTLYGSIQNGVLGKSTDGGISAFQIYDANGAWLTPFIQHPVNSQWLYTANNSVIRSTNGGSTFDTIATNVTTSDKINTMAISRVNPDIMILAGSGRYTMTPQVKVSTDGGFIWTDVTSNIPGEHRYVSRVVTHPNLPNVVYVVRSGFSPGNKIYMSTDLGSTWVNVSGNLPDVPVSDLFIDPEYDIGYFAATDLGVYLSVDGGVTWEREGMGMPFVPVMDFDYVKIGNIRYLRAATYGRSAFQTTDLPVPVELSSFTANSIDNNVMLNWITATETNNQGFEVQRSTTNSDFTAIGFVEGNGTTTEEHRYTFKDKDVSGTLRYRLKQIDFDGSYECSDVVEVSVNIPTEFSLEQNYPNPFNPITNISYSLPAESQVKLSIYNPLGELVETIVDEKQNAGKYDAVWNAGNHSSGIYIYSLDAVSLNGSEHNKISKKMILMK